MIADIDAAAGSESAAQIEQAGGSAAFVETDVGSLRAVENLISATVERYGRLDVIHSNAYHSAVGTATAITEADWERTLDVSLKATWMLAHYGFPAMLATGGGAAARGGPERAADHVGRDARCGSEDHRA